MVDRIESRYAVAVRIVPTTGLQVRTSVELPYFSLQLTAKDALHAALQHPAAVARQALRRLGQLFLTAVNFRCDCPRSANT